MIRVTEGNSNEMYVALNLYEFSTYNESYGCKYEFNTGKKISTTNFPIEKLFVCVFRMFQSKEYAKKYCTNNFVTVFETESNISHHSVKIIALIASPLKSSTLIAILYFNHAHHQLISSFLHTISYCSSLKFNEHKHPEELLRHIIYIRITLIWAF